MRLSTTDCDEIARRLDRYRGFAVADEAQHATLGKSPCIRQFLAKARTLFYICSPPLKRAPLVRVRRTRPSPPPRPLACGAKGGTAKEGRARDADRRLPEPGRVHRRDCGLSRRDGARHAQIRPRPSRPPGARTARRVQGAAGEPPQRGVARRLKRDVGSQPSGGGPRRDNRARTRPLSRFCFRRRARDAKAVPPRAAFPSRAGEGRGPSSGPSADTFSREREKGAASASRRFWLLRLHPGAAARRGGRKD